MTSVRENQRISESRFEIMENGVFGEYKGKIRGFHYEWRKESGNFVIFVIFQWFFFLKNSYHLRRSHTVKISIKCWLAPSALGYLLNKILICYKVPVKIGKYQSRIRGKIGKVETDWRLVSLKQGHS